MTGGMIYDCLPGMTLFSGNIHWCLLGITLPVQEVPLDHHWWLRFPFNKGVVFSSARSNKSWRRWWFGCVEFPNYLTEHRSGACLACFFNPFCSQTIWSLFMQRYLGRSTAYWANPSQTSCEGESLKSPLVKTLPRLCIAQQLFLCVFFHFFPVFWFLNMPCIYLQHSTS